MEIIIFIAIAAIAAFIFTNMYNKKKRREYLIKKYGDIDIVCLIMNRQIWQGMSSDQLLDSWGSPVSIDKKLYKTKTSHVFKYNKTGKNRYKNRVTIENDIVVGWKTNSMH